MEELNQHILQWVDEWIPDFIQSQTNWDDYRKKLLNGSAVSTVVSAELECQYMFKRGKRAGEPCGTSIKGNGHFCAKHKTVSSVAPEVFKLDLNKIKDESDDEAYSSSEDPHESDIEDIEDVVEDVDEDEDDNDDADED